MSRATDLTPFLAKTAEPDYGFRQGTVVAFNIFSGANTISCAGAVLVDVPFLDAGARTTLLAGDVVILVRMRSSWFILGQVNTPGGVNAIGRYFEVTESFSPGSVGNFAVGTTFTTLTTLNIPVPNWAPVANVAASLMLLAKNTTAASEFLTGKILMPNGGYASMPSASVPAGLWGQVTVTKVEELAVTPGGTLTILGQANSATGAWTAQASNIAFLQATVAFNSNENG